MTARELRQQQVYGAHVSEYLEADKNWQIQSATMKCLCLALFPLVLQLHHPKVAAEFNEINPLCIVKICICIVSC